MSEQQAALRRALVEHWRRLPWRLRQEYLGLIFAQAVGTEAQRLAAWIGGLERPARQ